MHTTGAGSVAQHLRNLARRAEVLCPAGERGVAREAARGWQRSMNRQGPGWPKLRPATVRDRIRQGYSPGPPMHRSGHLENSLDNPVVSTERDGMKLGVNVPYAVYAISKRPLKLDREAQRAMAQSLCDTLHSAYWTG